MPSIRRFLLINLLLTITFTTYISVVGNYYLDQKEIQNHLDLLMQQYAYSLQAVMSEEAGGKNLTKIQEKLNELPKITKNHTYIHESNYQIALWNKHGQLLLHSANAVNLPFSAKKSGFSDTFINGQPWRVFTLQDNPIGLILSVSEGYDIRNDLARRITRNNIYVMLITYPLCGLLIWIIIGRGLNVIKRIAQEVSNRVPTNLKPVSISNVPIEIKPLIDELNRLFLRLELALEREKRFAADAAHELRTPLAALKTQAQVVMKAHIPSELAQALQNIASGVDRCSHVVQQLLTLSRLSPEADTLSDTMVVNLVKLAAEIVAQIVPYALEKNIEIVLDSTKDTLNVMGNATALGILIRNLVDNAIRYSPPNGNVRIEIETKPKHVVLSVIDSGPGIPPELRSRVFERFFRILGTTAPGSGLGLAIVQQIARLHHAEIKLETPVSGSGLEIQVIFPAIYD